MIIRPLLIPLCGAIVALGIVASASRPSAQAPSFDEALLDGFEFRNLGPFRAGSWVADIAVPDTPARSHAHTIYVALRYGGVWKTTNSGVTFEPIFDNQSTGSMGSIAVAPSDERIIWVGTGDASNVRVSMPGDGAYKSTDGGRTWQRMGLADTHRIARIVIHPTKPDVVWVAAMGRLWSPNEERGVFRTTDGGRTWTKVLYVNDRTGAIDLVIDRRNPDTLYAAMYEVQRYPWRLVEGGAGTAIHKTTDGGRTWARLAGGLPAGPVGRIGLDLFQRDPRIVYAILENFTPRPPTAAEADQDRTRGREPRERTVGGEVYRTADGGRTWQKMNAATDDLSSKAGYSFNQIRVDQQDHRRILVSTDSLASSEDGGRTWKGLEWRSRYLFRNVSVGDFRAMWIDPQDSNRMLMGSDGGLHVSYDGGLTNRHFANLRGGEFYAIAVDMEDPYHIYGGMQDHDSWRGPINGWSGQVGPEDWFTVGDNDGMYNAVDPTDSRWVYNTVQWGGHRRADMTLRTRTSIEPRRPAGAVPLRFNWTPPLRISPHNSQILFTGAQVLLRSLDRGDHWEEISPDLTTNDTEKISPPGSTVQYCTITTIAESPLTAGVIWVGTDDGKVQVTRNHGATWTDATPAVAAAGGPPTYWVTRVLASSHAPGTAYVTKSGSRFDRPEPLVFRTTDFGATWTAIHANLPTYPVNVIVEDPVKADLLLVGTHAGVHVSRNGGGRWARLRANMPTVPVFDMLIHPREADLVVATYGRGLFVTHIGAVREMTDEVIASDLHLFAVRPRARRNEGAWGNYRLSGDTHALTPNEPNGLVFEYLLREKASGKAAVTVTDAAGLIVRTLEGDAAAGINRVAWNGLDDKRQPAAPGEYTVTIEVGGRKVSQRARLLAR
jgi:photosystem II stability/assembly factor-like uncharacterized protein